MTICYCDTETFSTIPLNRGQHKYSEAVEVMIVAYALDDGPVKIWDRTSDEAEPVELIAALNDPSVTVCGHNFGPFDRVMLKADKTLNINIPAKRVHDMMARAYSHGLPGGLDALCTIFNVPASKAKDKNGKRLIDLFCKPRKDGGRNTRLTHPLEWQKFLDYAGLDVEAVRYLDGKIPYWNYKGFEYDLWCLDQKINDRGIKIDTTLAQAAISAVKRERAKLAKRTDDITLGDVGSTTQRDELLRHILEAYGVELPDMQASTLERRLEDPELPVEVKELILIRLQASSSSTAKYSRFISNVSSDGRLRGALQFAGAQRTLRWAGRAVQLQNMPRPALPAETIDFGIECIKSDCEDLYFDDVMQLCSSAIRGCIVSDTNKKLVVSDLSNIEGRGAAWLANEEKKLEAFRLFDRGEGPDLYKKAYASSFKVDPKTVTKEQRAIGKVQELMLAYGGGCGAFITGAATYGVDLHDMTKRVLPELSPRVKEDAEGMWEWAVEQKRTLGLPRNIFIACDSLKRLWRKAHPNIEAIWKEIENAARNAIDSKDKIYTARKLSFVRNGTWLKMIKPSGFYLSYPAPRIGNGGEISFMGMSQYTRKWSRIKTYGAKIFENASQSFARDIMAWNMPIVEAAGYEIILHTHDELITEVPNRDEYTAEGLSKLLATNPPWTTGLPLAAAGFETYRYKKES